LEVTTQLRSHTHDPKLARNYGTNDRMLRYRCIDQCFYIDTFFANGKGVKSSRGNTCCQLFVSDQGFVYVVPLRHQIRCLIRSQAIRQGSLCSEAIVCDASKERTSLHLKRFMSSIGTTLRVLEPGPAWSTTTELYIYGLMKEAVRDDLRSTPSSLSFGIIELNAVPRVNNLTAKSLFQLHGQNPCDYYR